MKFFDVGIEAHGVIAIGQFATGIIAIGQVAVGVVALGQLSRGVFVVGQLAAGVATLGQVTIGIARAIGMIAVGGRASGLLSVSAAPRPGDPPGVVVGRLFAMFVVTGIVAALVLLPLVDAIRGAVDPPPEVCTGLC